MASKAILPRRRRRALLFGTLGLGLLGLCLTRVQARWLSSYPHAPAACLALWLPGLCIAFVRPQAMCHCTLWRCPPIRERVRAAGVHIYLVGLEPNITQPVAADDGALLFPGVNSLIPGVLEATVRALEHVHQHRLPGSAAPFVLRSNVSTFWNFWRLLA